MVPFFSYNEFKSSQNANHFVFFDICTQVIVDLFCCESNCMLLYRVLVHIDNAYVNFTGWANLLQQLCCSIDSIGSVFMVYATFKTSRCFRTHTKRFCSAANGWSIKHSSFKHNSSRFIGYFTIKAPHDTCNTYWAFCIGNYKHRIIQFTFRTIKCNKNFTIFSTSCH